MLAAFGFGTVAMFLATAPPVLHRRMGLRDDAAMITVALATGMLR